LNQSSTRQRIDTPRLPILPLDSTRKAIPIAQTANEQGARFSPDGHYIAYVGSEATAHVVLKGAAA